MGDVLPLISAHTLRADLQPHHQGVVDGFVQRSIGLPDPVHHVGVDLSKDERSVVFGAQVALLDGTNGNRATAVSPWVGGGGDRDGPGLRGGWHLPNLPQSNHMWVKAAR